MKKEPLLPSGIVYVHLFNCEEFAVTHVDLDGECQCIAPCCYIPTSVYAGDCVCPIEDEFVTELASITPYHVFLIGMFREGKI